jgi:hypothetical protein
MWHFIGLNVQSLQIKFIIAKLIIATELKDSKITFPCILLNIHHIEKFQIKLTDLNEIYIHVTRMTSWSSENLYSFISVSVILDQYTISKFSPEHQNRL